MKIDFGSTLVGLIMTLEREFTEILSRKQSELERLLAKSAYI